MAASKKVQSVGDFTATLGKGISGPVEDKEVEDLLSQFEEESLLGLKVNGHRSNHRWEGIVPGYKPDASDDRGIESSLAARLARLKRQDPPVTSFIAKPTKPPSVASEPAAVVSPTPEDILGAELASRMQALKGPSRKLAAPSFSSLKRPTTQGIILSSRRHPTSNTAEQSFSPAANVHQTGTGGRDGTGGGAGGHLGQHLGQQSTSRSFWGKGRRTSSRKADGNGLNCPPLFSEDGSRAEVGDNEVDSLLASIVDDMAMKKQTSVSQSFASSGGYMEDGSGSDEDLDEANVEREAESVVAWAKDNAALENKYEAQGSEIMLAADRLNGLSSSRQEEGHLEGEEEEMDHGYWQDDEGARSEEEGSRSGSGSFGLTSGLGRGLKRKS